MITVQIRKCLTHDHNVWFGKHLFVGQVWGLKEWRREMFTSARRYGVDLERAKCSVLRLKQVCAHNAVTVLRSWRNRRHLHRLYELDDGQLDDIGLCRHDVWLASQGSFFDDPSSHLTKAARRRARNLGIDP